MFKSSLKIKSYVSLLFFVFLVISIPSLSFAEDDAQKKLTPTAAPDVPAMDFTTEYSQLKIGGAVSYLKIENALPDGSIYMVTPGAGFTLTKALSERVGYSFGLGFNYLIIEDDSIMSDNSMSGSAYIFPLSFSLAFRIAGAPQTSNTMLFTGVNYSFLSMDMTTTMYSYNSSGPGTSIDSETEMTISGATYSAMFGIKTKLMISESFAILPFAAVQYTGTSMSYTSDTTVTTTTHTIPTPSRTVTSSSDSGSMNTDPVQSVILGFDIAIGGFSIGTMIDALSSTDGNKISVSASYTFKM